MEAPMIDSWYGVTDPAKRRKLQNRLNQRAYRRRLKEKKSNTKGTQQTQDSSPSNPSSETSSKLGNTVSVTADGAEELPSTALVQIHHASSNQPKPQFPDLDSLAVLGPCADSSKKILQNIEALLYAEYTTASPRTDLLLGVVRVNFLRGLHSNIEVLGYSASEMHDDALSHFGIAGPIKPSIKPSSSLPLALQPSKVQLVTPHHPWLDLLPIAQMRDNLILAGDSYDDIQLCRDMCGYGAQLNPDQRRGDAQGETGVIIWRDPWDPSGWEVTESFLRRWGWTVQGCTGLFRATNEWRGRRGEGPLFKL
ncbi:hypothetical protein BDV19DRAFT_401436 [Aspergillus venezuelensis]